MQKTFKSNKISGFSLPEMIVVMACLAVIVSLSFGDMNRMFTKQIEEQEKLSLKNIRKALEVYAEKEGKLPVNSGTCSATASSGSGAWNVELARYAEMTAERICIDEFGEPRFYKTKELEQNFRNGDFKYKFHVGSILSNGANLTEDTPKWIDIGGATGFIKYEPKVDDFIIKYNNNDFRLKQYEETLRRIDLLETYLERYVRSKRAYALSLDIDNFDNYIMAPKDGRSTDSGKYFDTTQTELTANLDFTSEIEVETIATKMSAVALTKILGVPEYYGQNALSGKSLWYISNPGPDRTRPCDNPRTSAPYYPPAVIVTTDDAVPAGCS